ncbi:unnamed protein product [Rotaria sordida]|uniref:GH18 domain-containing protein n=1 Tax=Rotaria sordida TaxID=392033 RepID=A0A813PFJ9_9BILA|nr:unnamed protein product [Rotaria sordida]CAF0774948.1 unnamed protein product [Rotaria sordida]CAF0811433.1 unnamed protein product [Rotaria sordida]
MKFLFIIQLIIIYCKKFAQNSDLRVVCYYTNWSLYREAMPTLYPDHIDPLLCTHIHFAFADINPLTLAITPTEDHDIHWTDRLGMPLYLRMYGLKRRNPSLKIILSVGGWSARSKGFNAVLRSDNNRAKFINQTIAFLQEWQFDGLDLDWEFPGSRDRGASADSKIKFNILIHELRQTFEDDAIRINKTNRLLLTAAVAADPKKIEQGYIIEEFCNSLDYVSVMTYDYHGKWDSVTGINSPLYRSHTEVENHEEWKNTNSSIYYWINQGCAASKINLGLALYGRSFTLASTQNTSIGASIVDGGGEPGPYTKEEGILAYFEICQKLRAHNWTTEWDEGSQSQFAYSDTGQWVGYDSLRSATLKVIWSKTMGLGGAMLWTLDYDDYTGLFCNRGEFPFTRRVHETMFDSILTTSTISTTNQSHTTTTPIRTSNSSIYPKLNRTNKPNFVLVVAPSHRTKMVSDSRMVNHAGDHLKYKFFLLFFLSVFHFFK